MSFDTIVMWIMASGALLGAVDKVLGNRFGLGDEFKKGYETMGPLTMGMVGIVCLTPLIQKGINSTIAPLFTAIGVDSAFLGAILANDMGGYQLSMELAADPRAGEIAGLLVACLTFRWDLALSRRSSSRTLSGACWWASLQSPSGASSAACQQGFPWPWWRPTSLLWPSFRSYWRWD